MVVRFTILLLTDHSLTAQTREKVLLERVGSELTPLDVSPLVLTRRNIEENNYILTGVYTVNMYVIRTII